MRTRPARLMRVLVDCRMASRTGVGRYVCGLVRALAARDDVEVVQACAPGEPPPVAGTKPQAASGAGGAEVVYVSGHPFGVRGALEVAKAAVEARVDLVHSPHFPSPVPVRGPLVVTMHDLTPLVVPAVMPSAVRRAAYRLWNERAARVAHRVLVPSAATAADVERLLPTARGKIAVTPEAADDFAAGPVGPLPPSLAALTAAPYLLAVGSAKPHKDSATLLRAFAPVAGSRPELNLLVVGDAPPASRDEAGAGPGAGRQPFERGRVVYTGHVADASLRALYTGAVAFVMPSFHEGFGLPVLEAMALGTPVVCADAASLPEVAGDAALLFAPRDAAALARSLMRLLDDAALRARLADAGRRRAALFTWASTAEASVVAYREALSCSRARPAPRRRNERGGALRGRDDLARDDRSVRGHAAPLSEAEAGDS